MIEARVLPWVRRAHTAEEIARGIEGDIAVGRLAPGDRLPSPASLSKTAGVPLGIGRSAYETLAEAGFVDASRQGTFVAADVVAAPEEIIVVAERLAMLGDRLGVSSRTLEVLVYLATNDIDAHEVMDDFTTKELRA